jgi:uncharacterized membrane protein
MADLLVIAYPTEAQAEEIRGMLFEMQKEYLIQLGDAAIAVKRPDGSVKLNQVVNTTAAGATGGALWGALIGMLFLNPIAGAAIGAGAGALSGRFTDVGINDAFMKEVAASLDSGNAALFLLIRKVTPDKVLARLEGTGGKIMRSSFDESKEAALRAALVGAGET